MTVQLMLCFVRSRSRNREGDRERREKERDRRKKGLPTIKHEHLSSEYHTVIH